MIFVAASELSIVFGVLLHSDLAYSALAHSGKLNHPT